MVDYYQLKGEFRMTIKKLDMIADYDFWVRFDSWGIQEMTPILMGVNPLYVNQRYVDQLSVGLIETSMSQKDIDLFVSEYDKTHALILNSIEEGKLKFRVTPKKFYEWAVSKELPIHEKFHRAIQNHKPHNENRGFNPKRKRQLYKIILALAIKYKFNPKNLKNPSTSKFRNAIERAGLTIDDNTIRDVIARSYEHHKEKLDHSIFEDF